MKKIIVMVVFMIAFVANNTFGQTPQIRNIQGLPINGGTSTTEKINKILLDFYNKYPIPGGMSLAVSYQGNLIYAGAIGYADKNRTIPMTPEHRMRLASVSKSVTATAIWKLVDDKKLNINDLVFGEKGILGTEYGIPMYNDKPAEITVKHLLEHTAGGWGNDTVSTTIRRHMIGKEKIQAAIRQYPLTNSPGSKYIYSGVGYYMLGRVIEKASGMSYENYVKVNILSPAGINGMRLGSEKSAPDEAEYIGETRDSIPTSDASSGWIANPMEFVKMMDSKHARSHKGDVFWSYSGSMSGSSTLARKRTAGYNYAIFMNCSSPSGNTFSKDRSDLFPAVQDVIPSR